MDEVLERFGGQFMVLAVIVLTSVGAALSVRGRRPWIFGLVPAPTCMAIGSAVAIACATLTRQTGARAAGRVQLEPLHTLRVYWGDRSDLAIFFLGNVALFVPLGFFLYLALCRGLLLPFALTVLASVAVEIAQLPIWSRSSDVDDVLLNGIGGLAGVLAAAAYTVLAQRAEAERRRIEPRTEQFATILPRR